MVFELHNQEVTRQMKQEQYLRQREQPVQSLMCLERYGQGERCRAQLCFPDALGFQHFQLGVIARLCRARLMAALWISVPTRLEGERQRVGPSLHP